MRGRPHRRRRSRDRHPPVRRPPPLRWLIRSRTTVIPPCLPSEDLGIGLGCNCDNPQTRANRGSRSRVLGVPLKSMERLVRGEGEPSSLRNASESSTETGLGCRFDSVDCTVPVKAAMLCTSLSQRSRIFRPLYSSALRLCSAKTHILQQSRVN